MTEENLFSAEPTAAIDQLVGDGKKFKTIEDLAKAKLESDAFIANLQRENAGIREDLNARVRMEQLLERLETLPDEGTNRSGDNHTPDNSPDNRPDLETIIEQKLTKREAEKKVSDNVNAVKDGLRKYFGDDYDEKLRARVAKLQLSESVLNGLAKESPKDFFKLLEITDQRSDPVYTPPTSKTYIPTGISTSGTKSFKDYEAIRKADPVTYWKPETQLALHRSAQEAAANGEDFYK